jgi:GT2 family glycosyltransferase
VGGLADNFGSSASGHTSRISGPIAAVVIGRNEGERLEPSLRSVQAAGLTLVYADSASRDGSPALARKLKAAVVELDPARPLSAARGRNEGMNEALKRWPETQFVLFLDGDCVLNQNFPAAAIATLQQHAECAIVTGHLSERHPDASIYNRLCAIEWRGPAGCIENMNGLGGIMAARVSALREVGGFNEQAIAGEEPDLGVRLRLAGYSIIKIDHGMATHDAQMTRFSQWWTRAVRGGHALAHRYARHGRTRFKDGSREIRSAMFWGLSLPVLILLLLWPTRGLALLLAGAYPAQGWRMYRRYVRDGLSPADSSLVTRFTLLGKIAEVVGIFRYCLNRLRGRYRIIEYK